MLTSHPTKGIGGWTDDEIKRALTKDRDSIDDLPQPAFVVPPLAWRICRAVRRCTISCFFSTLRNPARRACGSIIPGYPAERQRRRAARRRSNFVTLRP